MRRYRCPTCGKPLTKKEHDAALRLTEEQHKHQLEEVEKARKQGREAERGRTASLTRKIGTLEATIRQLRRGQTPQTAGMDDQHKMAVRLQREFEPLGDTVTETGQKGDVVHTVVHEDKAAGLIVYECKNSADPDKRIPGRDIRQTALAKQTLRADFAVLVTTGKRSGFGGYIQIDGVLICGPLCAIPLAELLRLHLVEMARANVTRRKRAQVAQQLLEFIASPSFKNVIEDAVQVALKLEGMITKEAESHQRVWDERLNLYRRIQWDVAQIQANVASVMQGKEPQPIPRLKRSQFQLLAPKGRKQGATRR